MMTRVVFWGKGGAGEIYIWVKGIKGSRFDERKKKGKGNFEREKKRSQNGRFQKRDGEKKRLDATHCEFEVKQMIVLIVIICASMPLQNVTRPRS